jgi:AcrR family transcriptional regulator
MTVSTNYGGLLKAQSKKRDAIILATLQLAAEKGINGASTILIAERAQAAEVTIFRHFKTKESLLHTIFDEELERFQEFIMLDHDEGLPIQDRFYCLCSRALQYFFDNPLVLSFVEQYMHTPLGWGRRPDMRYHPGERFESFPLIYLLVEGVKAGEVKDLSIPSLMGMVVGGLGSCAREHHLKSLKKDPEKIDALIEACWGAVKS